MIATEEYRHHWFGSNKIIHRIGTELGTCWEMQMNDDQYCNQHVTRGRRKRKPFSLIQISDWFFMEVLMCYDMEDIRIWELDMQLDIISSNCSLIVYSHKYIPMYFENIHNVFKY